MGLKRLTVVSKNGDTGITGVTLFNSDYIEEMQANTSGTFFYLRKHSKDSTPDKYIVSDVVGTSYDTFDQNNGEIFRILVEHDDPLDSASSTTNKVYDLTKIVKGIPLPSDTTQSLLWVETRVGEVEKKLVDNFLKAIEDYWQTGTTTTYE